MLDALSRAGGLTITVYPSRVLVYPHYCGQRLFKGTSLDEVLRDVAEFVYARSDCPPEVQKALEGLL
jgi:hypothetical protein